MNLQTKDIFRLTTLIAGIIFFLIGIIMVLYDISAEGVIDITSVVISGKLRTGSAGLFIILFAFIMIILASIPEMSNSIKIPVLSKETSSFGKSFKVFVILSILFIVSVIGFSLSDEGVRAIFGGAAVFSGFVIFIWIFIMADTL
jgi:hypothetical protein